MKALSEIEIKYYENDVVKVRYKAPVTASAFVHYELMNSHYVKLSFHSAKAIGFRIGDFIELPNWGRFEIVEPVKPQYDGAEYTYEPQFEAYYRKWKNKKVRYIPESGFPEAYFTLTASILVHARIILRNLAYLVSKDKSYLFNRNYTSTDKDTIGDNNAVYGKTDFTIFVDSTVDVKKARNISYQNINILDAITQVASTFECEWWVTENVIHFGECKLEQKADVELKSGTNVASISSSPSTSNYFTRLLSFGAARNLPDTYKKDGITDVTKEGVVEQRLMLPTVDELIEYAATSDTAKAVVDKVNKELSDNGFELVGNYLQVKGLSEQQYIEGAVTNDDDYPKNIIEIGKVETYAKEVKNNATADENDTITRTYYRLSGLKLVNEDGVQIGEPEFLDKYILKGKDLSILFQSGSLNGLDFTCKFNPLGKPLYKMNSNGAFVDKDGNETTDKSKYVVNPESQCFEVCANENYGRTLPDPDLCPKVGDTFVLYNWDATMMPGNLIMEASVDLLLDTIEYLKKSMIDPTTYTATMLSDYVFKSKRYFSLGEAVKLNNPAFFTTPRDSRVIGYEIKLDIPWDSPQYIIGEKPSYSKIGDLAQRVSELAYNGKSYSGSGIGGTSVYIVTSNDNTPFSDTNTLSSLRAQKEFLSKTQDDETAHKLTMGEAEVKGDATVGGDATIRGKVVTDDIHSSDSDGNTSMTGKGWTLRNVSDETGSYSVLAVDNIVVRKKLEAAELEIHRKTYVGAQQIASDWGHKILRVDPMAYDTETGEVSSVSGLTLFTLPVTVDGVERPVAFVGRALSDTETRVELLGDGKGVLNQELETTANAFKVYFCESDGTTSIEDDLVVGSMGQCQEFNVKERVTHNFQNTYYWGVCVMHGVEDNVLIGGKPTKCVYGVFAHTTKLLTLTSEVSKHTFTCYGMEQSGCTFPVAGDDMVGFGCADPWQDADRCNAIVIASKDGEISAPSVIAYSGIGRMRGGSILETPKEDITVPDYIDIKEQYSLPSEKDDSRLDFRVSRRAGNVFKGDLYFKGDDNTIKPVGESYMLSADKSVVENGGKLSVTIYRVNGSKVVAIKAEEVKEKNFSVWLYRDNNTNKEVTSTYENLNWNNLTGDKNDIKSVTLNLRNGNDVLDTISVSLGEKALPRTVVWRLVPVQEIAESNYEIDRDEYGNYAEKGETGDDTINNIFVKSTEINLQYYIVYQQGTSSPIIYTKVPAGKVFSVSAFTDNEATVYSYSSNNETGTVVDDKIQNLRFSDRSDTNAQVSTIKRIAVQLFDSNSKILDQRMVIPQLGTNGVADMNKDFLAYIYYGTDGTGGAQYTNKRISTMEGNYTDLTSRMENAEGGIKDNTQKITETAEKYERVLEQVDQEKTDRGNAERDLKTSIEATAKGIRTTVSSLYTEGNLLTGGDVRGSLAKRYQAYVSPTTTHLKKGITYTVTARMWLEAKDDYPTQPKMDGHFMTMFVYTEDWESVWSHRYTYTKSGTVVDSFSFTPESDIDVLVGIYEQNSEGLEPKEYGGVSVNWVRLDMGDRTGEKQIVKWTPSSGDVEARNLIPDPNFEVSSWETTDGASSRGTEGDVSFMSRYTDDYEDYGFRGVRMTRSGYTEKYGNSDGLIYYIPFRGEGDYAAQAFIKDLNGVTLDDVAFIEVHPADVNQRRICYGFGFGLSRRTDETGYSRVSRTFHFGMTATNAASGESQEIHWLEVRVLLMRNGDVVVSRLSLAKCGHAVHWNADALGAENGKTLSMESYVDQRADSLEAGIRQGLKSVGFRMDSSTWSVNTWGNRFAWYANDTDAQSGDTSKAVMYVDTQTNTLHVKGSVTANLLYGKTKEVVFSESMSSYTIDPQNEPATTYFVNNHYNYRSNFFILPKASDYDGLEISIFCKRTFTDTRLSVDAYKVFVKCANTSDHLYAKKNVANVLKAGASSLNDYKNVATVEDKWINYTDFIGTSVMIQQNSLVKFKSIGGAWYAIEGLFTGE